MAGRRIRPASPTGACCGAPRARVTRCSSNRRSRKTRYASTATTPRSRAGSSVRSRRCSILLLPTPPCRSTMRSSTGRRSALDDDRNRQRSDRAHRPHVVRLHGAVRAHDGAGHGQSTDRRIQHVFPGEVGADRNERAVRTRPAVARDARRQAIVERGPRMVRELGEAARVEDGQLRRLPRHHLPLLLPSASTRQDRQLHLVVPPGAFGASR